MDLVSIKYLSYYPPPPPALSLVHLLYPPVLIISFFFCFSVASSSHSNSTANSHNTTSHQQSNSHSSNSNANVSPSSTVHYRHLPVQGFRDCCDSYLTMAYEVVLIGLGQQRNMPVGLYAQDKACRAEEELIKRHRDIPLDERLVEVLQKQVRTLMEGEHPSDVFSHRAMSSSTESSVMCHLKQCAELVGECFLVFRGQFLNLLIKLGFCCFKRSIWSLKKTGVKEK